MANMSVEVDIDDWEFLPDTGYYDFNGGKSKYSSKEKAFARKGIIRPFPATRLIDIPSPETPKATSPASIAPLQVEKLPFIDIGVIPPVTKDQDTVSRVFFKKMKENEFADMKMDSPKSSSNKGLKLLTDAGAVQFEDKEEVYQSEPINHKTNSEVVKNEEEATKKKGVDWGGDLDLWGWKVNGVGALCCIGVAAATTICIVIFGSRRGNKQNHNQKIQFQIHSDDKRIKTVVQPENFISQAIAAARDVPLNGAIYFGGY